MTLGGGGGGGRWVGRMRDEGKPPAGSEWLPWHTLTIAREENGAPEEAAAILYQAESGWTQTRETVPNTGT